MIANPEFDLEKHDASDSKTKFGYYFSLAEPGMVVCCDSIPEDLRRSES